MKIIDCIIDAIYPPTCPCCGKRIVAEEYFCPKCKLKIAYPSKDVCKLCGFETKRCDCKRYIYHFDGICGAFKNEGVAQKAFYTYKFKRDTRILRFFVKSIAKVVRRQFSDIKFDFVTAVPASDPKTEFDHAKKLAVGLAKSLDLKFIDCLKSGSKSRKTQHQLSYGERFSNVQNAYEATQSLKGKTVLLVDDIKTTGATIDECAKELKFAGADRVYCAVALIGYKNQS